MRPLPLAAGLLASCIAGPALAQAVASPAAGPAIDTSINNSIYFDPSPSLHGFAEAQWKNFYATPRGLLVHDKGFALQVLEGLVLDFAGNKNAVVSDFSVSAGTWTDLNPGYQAPNHGANVNEVDYFAGLNTVVLKNLTLGAQYVAFTSPQRAFHVEHNIEFSGVFDDSSFLKPVSIQPYAKIFYAVSGSSTIITGRMGSTFDVELGAVPTYKLPTAFPITLTAPSWITLAPKTYYGGDSNFGVYSIGLKAATPLDFIHLGHWHADAGVQFYHILNSKLILAQMFDGSSQFGTNGHRNFAIWSVGVGLGF